MKKLSVTILTFLTCGVLYALPVGNPSDASLLADGFVWQRACPDFCDPCTTWCDWFSFRLGFYGDYVFNRHLEVRESGRDAIIEDCEIFTNAAYLIVNIYERADIFCTLGVSNLFIDTNVDAFSTFAGLPELSRGTLDSVSAFSWSLGARVTLWECGCTSVGAEGQYFQTNPDLRRVSFLFTNDSGIISIYNDRFFQAKYQEWQAGVGISHRFHFLCPYLAVKWSGARVSFDDATFTSTANFLGPITFNLPDLKNQKWMGWELRFVF